MQVMKSLTHRTEIHYCAYGGSIRKPTMLFSSFQLEAFGFKSLKCQGHSCLAKLGSTHASWEKIDKRDRQSIPELVSTQIGQAISKYITEKCKHQATCIRDTHGVEF